MLKFIRKLFRITQKVQIYFSPSNGCADTIVSLIKNARKSIYIQAYTFSLKEISDALIDAKKIKIDIQFIGDKSGMSSKGSLIDDINNAGITCFIDSKHRIAHNKIIIIDNKIVVTGSYNFTKNGEIYNAENLVIINDKKIALTYLDNWNNHKSHSIPYVKQSLMFTQENLF